MERLSPAISPEPPPVRTDTERISLHHLDGEGAVRGDLPVIAVKLVFGENRVPTPALDDSGAGANFITLELAHQIGFDERWSRPGPSVALGDTSSVPCYGQVRMRLQLDPDQPENTVEADAYVVETLGFPLILGYPFGRALKKSYRYEDSSTTVAWTTKAGTLLLSKVVDAVHTDAQLHHMAVQVANGDNGAHSTPILQVHLAEGDDHPRGKDTPKGAKPPYEVMIDQAPARLHPLLRAYRDIFVRDKDKEHSQGHGVVAKIPTAAEQVSYTKQFPLAQKHLVELKAMLDGLLEKEWIETAHSPFNNPIFLVPKPNGKWRIVLDFRGLNKITVKDKYRLPRVDHLLNEAMKWNVLSTMDLVDGFYQIPLSEADRHKTAFTTPWGSYQWKVMPMGLCNAPSIFQGVTDALLQGMPRTVGYVDDLATGGASEMDHDKALEALFGRIRQFGLHLAPHKCHFSRGTTEFLGYKVGGGVLSPTPGKIEAVKNYPTPQSQTQVRSFLGLVGYHGRFIEHFHVIAGPLEQLSGRNDKAPAWADRNWGPEQEQAFQALKGAMISAPVLRAPDWEDTVARPFILSTDASGYGMGACLMQAAKENPEGPPHPLGFWSRTFNEVEQRRLATHERELCALMEGLECFRTVILHYDLQVWCDHKPLMHLMDQPHLTAKQARWMHRISPFLPFSFVYTPGKSAAMGPADALSRKDEGTDRIVPGPLKDVVPALAAAIEQGHSRVPPLLRLHHLQPERPWILLLCSGQSQSVERYIRQRRPEAIIVTLDHDPECCPTLCGSVLEWERLLAEAGLSSVKWDLIWASPPCTLFSSANWRVTDVGPGLDIVRAVLDCIEACKPRLWVLENPAEGSRALHLQAIMEPYAPYRTQTSYCWYGTQYRKSTSFWTSFGATLRKPCKPSDPCPCVLAYGRHPFVAQKGPKSGRSLDQLGMGGGRAVEGYPRRLLCALLDEQFPAPVSLHAMTPRGTRGGRRNPEGPAAGEDTRENADDAREPEPEASATTEPIDEENDDALTQMATLVQDIRHALRKDPVWRYLRHKATLSPSLEEGGPDEDEEGVSETPTQKSVWEERYEIRDDLIRLKEDSRIYIPASDTLKDTIVHTAHQNGHFGLSKTYAAVSQHLWWPGMREDIARRVASCQVCRVSKTNRQARPGLLQPLPISREAWRSVSIDWISSLPSVRPLYFSANKKYPEGVEWVPSDSLDGADGTVNTLFVLTDRYSKAVRLRACHKSSTGAQVIGWLKEELFRAFGWPTSIISDNDVRFGKAYKEYLESQGIDLRFTSGWHPQANGQVERMNSTVQNVLRCVCNGLSVGWPAALPDVEYAINSSAAVHGKTPFELFLQFPPRNPLERALGIGSQPKSALLPSDAIHTLVQKRLEEEQARQKATFDKKHRPLTLEVGDRVYLRRSAFGVGRNLAHTDRVRSRNPFLGPYRVVRRKRNCDNTYVLDVDGEIASTTWHVSQLCKAAPAGSSFDTPRCPFTPKQVLASRRDLDGYPRYLTLWEQVEGHTWELEEHLGDTKRGRDLLTDFRRGYGRHVGATSDVPILDEHPEWLEEVVC
jgi:hypothetical protein